MTKYTQIKICEISDKDFHSMITELCDCTRLGKDQFVNQSFHFMLTAIVKEGKPMTKPHLLMDGILTTKVDKLKYGFVLFQICQELAGSKGATIEAFDGKTVLALIKTCSKTFCPSPTKQKKPTRSQNAHRARTELILQKRRNGVF